jgi:hypothetical protein
LPASTSGLLLLLLPLLPPFGDGISTPPGPRRMPWRAYSSASRCCRALLPSLLLLVLVLLPVGAD